MFSSHIWNPFALIALDSTFVWFLLPSYTQSLEDTVAPLSIAPTSSVLYLLDTFCCETWRIVSSAVAG